MASNTVLTCGVCMSYVENKTIAYHKCVQDWFSVTIDTKSKTFYPTNQKGEYLAKVIWENKEQLLLLKQVSDNSSFINQPIEINNEDLTEANSSNNESFPTSENISQNSTSSSEKVDSTLLEEMLIEEVKQRPPIYDYTLPLSVRGRQQIADLWKDISEALNGLMSPEEAKKRWKTLKDTFSKAMAEEKKPSGSSRSSSKKPWKHLELMSFLRSVSTYKSSISNVTATINDSNNNLLQDTTDNIIEEYKDKSFVKHRAKGSDDLNASMTRLTRIADELCKKEVPVINLPKLPEIAALDGLFLYIKEKLQKFSSEKQDELLLKFLQDIMKEQLKE